MSNAAAQFVNHSARRINKIAAGLSVERYLEIGVSSGTTFHAVKVRERTAVDPHFRFPAASRVRSNTHYHEIPSDDFFFQLPVGAQYDLIFIDGLHTFEQTLRDFSNSMMHSHQATVWLIDDTMPTDVYSSFKNQEDTFRFRGMNKDLDKSWHGDVFKLVFFIHDFCPGLNFRTITGSGNAQTLVWVNKERGRQPKFNDLEKISRLDYFDMHKHIDILRPTPEDDAIRLCVTKVQSETLRAPTLSPLTA